MPSRRHRCALVVAIAVVALPSTAGADWLLSLYAGGAATSSNTLAITPPSGDTVTIGDVSYEGRSWASPIYYGYRAGWTPAGAHFGIEAEFTHAKAIATSLPSAGLTAFQLSHGLNFILGNLTYRTSPACGGRCTFVARGGAGITYPHVEATFRGASTSAYEYAGLGVHGGAGIELKLIDHWYVVADARVTHARVRTDLADGDRLAGPFTTRHADIGVGWHSGR